VRLKFFRLMYYIKRNFLTLLELFVCDNLLLTLTNDQTMIIYCV